MFILRMAWRNIGRNLRRSLITISATGFGLSVLLFQQSFVAGFQNRMLENSVRLHTGHIQIHKAGYQRQKKVELMIDEPSPIDDEIRKIKGVVAYSQRVNFRGLVSSAENSGGVQVFGIEPERERGITLIAGKMKDGEYLSNGDDKSILLGEALSEDLGIGVGDKVVLMAQAVDGSLSAELFKIKGIFEAGSPVFEEGVAYVTKEAAQRMLVMEMAITEFIILVYDKDAVEPVLRQLRERPVLSGLEVLSWQDISPQLVQVIELQGSALLIVLSIVFMIVALGVVNTLLMSVMERVREFGIMMSLGTKPLHIISLIITEAFYLGILGLIFGVVFGFSVVFYFSMTGIDLSGFAEATANFLPAEKVIYPTFNPRFTVISSIAVILTTLLSAPHPAFKAARLKPVEALRYV